MVVGRLFVLRPDSNARVQVLERRAALPQLCKAQRSPVVSVRELRPLEQLHVLQV